MHGLPALLLQSAKSFSVWQVPYDGRPDIILCSGCHKFSNRTCGADWLQQW